MKLSKVATSMVAMSFVIGAISGWGMIKTETASNAYSVSSLSYTQEDLAYIGKGECVLNMESLNKNEGSPKKVTINKWEGDDIILAVPYLVQKGSFTGESYIIDKDGLSSRLKFEEYWPSDLQLLPDKIVVSMEGIYEFNYSMEQLYGIEVKQLSHRISILDNGNFAIVRTGLDQALEITREGEIVWEWNALSHIQDYNDKNYTGYGITKDCESLSNPAALYRQICGNHVEWTHINTIQKLDDGYLLGLRNLDLIIKVNEKGDVVWSFGNLVIKHAHDPSLLNNGNILVFDNGNGKTIEFNPANGNIVWKLNNLLAPAMGHASKVWNGNYLITDCYRGTIYEITPENKILKEIKIEGVWIPWARAFNPTKIPNYKLLTKTGGK